MSWSKVKLGDILKRKRTSVIIDPEKDYKLVTIKLHHKGITLRSLSKGSSIKSSMSSIKKGDFILSGIDARNGAFGIVPEDLDNAIITNDFWCLEPNEHKISREFFLYITSTSFFDYICKQSSDGTTQRIRLQKDRFFKYEINLPELKEQNIILEKLNFISINKKNIQTEIDYQLYLIKQLRQAFLREAMQGLLVKTEANGETGAQLLEKIKAEKTQLIKEKKLKKEKELPPISEDEIPFEIPENWTWCRLGEVCSKIGSGSTPKGSNYSLIGLPFFRSQNVHDKGLIYDDIKYITTDVHKQMNGTIVLSNDILLNITGGSMGRCAYVPSDFVEGNVSQHVCIIRPLSMNNLFIHKLILSPYFQQLIFSSTTGAGREGLPKCNLEQFIIPLPPLHEQHQIVAKLDELMAFCDGLEESIKASQDLNEKLLQEVLREALQG